MTNREYEYIIEQQKELIKQQKDLIDKLLIKVNVNNRIVIPIERADKNTTYTCIAPKNADCDKECDSCCYNAKLC